MDKEKEMPKRKDLRLKYYDYSSAGAYFVTICIKDRKRILSDIIPPSVGGGAHDAPQIRLTEIGKTVEKYLLSSESVSGVKIDQYVIMPDHIHAIIFLYPDRYVTHKDGASWCRDRAKRASTCSAKPRTATPTNEMLPHVVSTFKRLCNKDIGSNIFQRGYMEHVIRDREDYKTRMKYIYENPIRWYYEKL